MDAAPQYFGAQPDSCETDITAAQEVGGGPYRGVFIRAPAILRVGAGVEVLARITRPPHPLAARVLPPPELPGAKRRRVGEEGPGGGSETTEDLQPRDVVVAARQGPILVTAFHPELTSDRRWHEYFLRLVANARA